MPADSVQQQNRWMIQSGANQAATEALAGNPSPVNVYSGAKMKNPPASENLPFIAVERPRFLEEGLPIPPDYAMWLFIIYSLKKNPQMLERLAVKWMDTQHRIITALAQAGAGNIVTAYSHSFLIGLMLEQSYWIRQRGADDLISGLNWLTGAEEAGSIIKDILGGGGFSVPQVLQFATPERMLARKGIVPPNMVQSNPREAP